MGVKIAVLRERDPETRVAATPDSVKRLLALGASVAVERDAGARAGLPDAGFEEAGATLGDRAAVVADADVVLCVRRPDLEGLDAKDGALLVGLLNPYDDADALQAMAGARLRAVSMDLLPRITRAQSMDVLSSQANLAGYRAVIDAADAFQRALPMMMTAAGTVPAAKVFVMGAGVAGLQAIATARRLGAIVTATDVRAAAGEQVESLGAKFIMHESLKDASGEGGYARELTEAERTAQADLVAGHIAKQDIVVTTALIPGRPAPKLVSKAMITAMKPGSVVADLAAERGGNVEVDGEGERIEAHGVTVLRFANMPGRIAASASQLYARNLLAYLTPLIEDGQLKVDASDEIVAATLLTKDGAVVHPRFAAKTGEAAMNEIEVLAARAAQAAEAAGVAAAQAGEAARQAALLAQGQVVGNEAVVGGIADTAAATVGVDPTVFRLAIFVLACFVGYYVVWSVTPALHTPLMSVTNAISSVIVVGALLAVGAEAADLLVSVPDVVVETGREVVRAVTPDVVVEGRGTGLSKLFGFVALVLASINIVGGFLVTQRMLAMYKKR